MATAPIVTVVTDTDQTVSNWDVGTIQANNDSAVLTVRIWNNRGGASAVSDLKDCNITSLDVDGGSTSDVITGKWMNINVQSIDGNTTTWTQVGGTVTKALRADGVTAADGNIIRGTTNDGNANNSKVNYCTVKMKLHVPLNATSGARSWKMRINGYYV